MSFQSQLVTAGVVSSDLEWPGGQGVFMGESSNWNGATVTLQYLFSVGNWIDVSTAQLTDNEMKEFLCPMGRVRAVVAGSPTDLNIIAARVIT